MRKAIFLLLALRILIVGAAAAPCVALTFDDGPSGKNTEALMELLEDKDVKATFFLCGYRMEAYPELPGALLRAGHELGSHGYSHTCFDKLSEDALREEVNATREQLLELTGQAPKLLRPPCGVWNEAVREACREAELGVVLWSVDPEDWRCRDSREIARRVCAKADDGSIILMHDMYPSSVEACAEIIDTLRGRGFEFVTVSELAARQEIDLSPGEVFGGAA